MTMPSGSEYDYEANFDKAKVIALANDIRKFLTDLGIGTQIWSVQPWIVTLQISTSRPDLSEVICEVYKRPEVMMVGLGVEPNTRVMLMSVQLTERWFVDGKQDGKAGKRNHPEAEGGSLA